LGEFCRSGTGLTWSQQFGLPELTREALATSFRVKGQAVGLNAATFGSDLYRETRLGIALSRTIRSGLAVGVAVNGHWLEIEGQPKGRAITASAGAVVTPISGLAFGAVWKNLNEPRISGYVDRIRETLTVGVAASVGKSGTLAADIVQEKFFPAEFRVGAEAQLLPTLCLRVGARAEPVRPSAGFEVVAGRWSFAYSGDLHPDLGPSHEIGLQFRFEK
jgi:hypothetical protein